MLSYPMSSAMPRRRQSARVILPAIHIRAAFEQQGRQVLVARQRYPVQTR